jgi:hypothetical protein
MDLEAHAKSEIESMTCDIHHKSPALLITGKGMYIRTCCTDFKIECLRCLIEILNDYKENSLHVAWKAEIKPYSLTRI